MPGGEQVNLTVLTTAAIAPAAVYFLLLGLLNSQPRPQLLSGRTDFVLLNAAFLPVFCVPLVQAFGAATWVLPAAIGALIVLAMLLAPPRGNWSVYNISPGEALRAGERALREMGEPFRRRGRRLVLTRRDACIRLASMPLLRHVSISIQRADAEFVRRFEQHLAEQLGRVATVASPVASALLVIATVMLVTPLGLLANRMPEMVRIITDLVK